MHEMLVDTCAMEPVRAPEQFEVIVTTNFSGGIPNDEAGMFVGGLGVAASGNISVNAAVFESGDRENDSSNLMLIRWSSILSP